MKTLSINHLIVLFITCLSFFACDSPADISGKLEGVKKEGVKVYLIKPGSLQEIAASYFGKVMDSTVVDADGRFEFRSLPVTEEPVLLELAVEQPGRAPNFLNTDDPEKSNFMPIIWQGEPLQVSAGVD